MPVPPQPILSAASQSFLTRSMSCGTLTGQPTSMLPSFTEHAERLVWSSFGGRQGLLAGEFETTASRAALRGATSERKPSRAGFGGATLKTCFFTGEAFAKEQKDASAGSLSLPVCACAADSSFAPAASMSFAAAARASDAIREEEAACACASSRPAISATSRATASRAAAASSSSIFGTPRMPSWLRSFLSRGCGGGGACCGQSGTGAGGGERKG
mmetsp:Transcript_148141/g.369333  ORF Transcript_148141/g.369333 Transcript_148141/m.369333 type:complete len:216 (+) Transcript_148141:765-1412(+)